MLVIFRILFDILIIYLFHVFVSMFQDQVWKEFRDREMLKKDWLCKKIKHKCWPNSNVYTTVRSTRGFWEPSKCDKTWWTILKNFFLFMNDTTQSWIRPTPMYIYACRKYKISDTTQVSFSIET